MNESNVIRYDAGPGGMEKCPDGDFVTHADYRALEEKYLELWDVQAWTTNQLDEAREELAALRGKVGKIKEFVKIVIKEQVDESDYAKAVIQTMTRTLNRIEYIES